MNWRRWSFDTLRADTALIGIVPEVCIWGAGSVNAVPGTKPFIVLRFGNLIVNEVRAGTASLDVWAHDEPGDYERIDTVLGHVRRILNGARPHEKGAVVVQWTGDSQDLADDGYGTITRNSSYRLVGSE